MINLLYSSKYLANLLPYHTCPKICSVSFYYITKTRLFKYIENFTSKNWKFSDKNFDIFHNSAQNIDFGYLLELSHQGSSNEYPQSMFSSKNKKNNVYPM